MELIVPCPNPQPCQPFSSLLTTCCLACHHKTSFLFAPTYLIFNKASSLALANRASASAFIPISPHIFFHLLSSILVLCLYPLFLLCLCQHPLLSSDFTMTFSLSAAFFFTELSIGPIPPCSLPPPPPPQTPPPISESSPSVSTVFCNIPVASYIPPVYLACPPLRLLISESLRQRHLL